MSGDTNAAKSEPPAESQPERSPQSQTQPRNEEEERPEAIVAKLGVLAFGVVAVGVFILNLLSNLLSDEDASIFGASSFQSEEELFSAVTSTLTFETFGIILAVAFAVYFYHVDSYELPAVKSTPIAVAAGYTTVAVLFLLLAVVLEPDGFDISIGDELVGFIARLAGLASIGALTAYVLDEDPLELLK